jgi:hypothetical protein
MLGKAVDDFGESGGWKPRTMIIEWKPKVSKVVILNGNYDK